MSPCPAAPNPIAQVQSHQWAAVINHCQHVNASEPCTLKARVAAFLCPAPDKKELRRARRNPTYLSCLFTNVPIKAALNSLSLRKPTRQNATGWCNFPRHIYCACTALMRVPTGESPGKSHQWLRVEAASSRNDAMWWAGWARAGAQCCTCPGADCCSTHGCGGLGRRGLLLPSTLPATCMHSSDPGAHQLQPLHARVSYGWDVQEDSCSGTFVTQLARAHGQSWGRTFSLHEARPPPRTP